MRAVPRRATGHQARRTLDHRIAHVGGGCSHERNPLGSLILYPVAYPLGSRAGLTPAAPGQDQPDLPACLLIFRRKLLGPAPKAPVVEQGLRVFLTQVRQRLLQFVFGQRGQRYG